MTPEDEEFLTELYRNLTKQAVPPMSPLYVALEELPGQVMGPDAVKLLGRTRANSATPPPPPHSGPSWPPSPTGSQR